jgi:membrane-bound lytic murein transglycosylase D
MNKLLLLATGLISFTLHDFAAANPKHSQSDSTFEQVVVNPKDAFKDLFETETVNGMDVSKLNPKAVSFVQDYMEANSDMLMKMKNWGKPYFDMMSNVLAQRGLPAQLKYLAVIESELKPTARSWVGAVGPWQLMPATARLLGLKVNGRVDERKDFVKSTTAASKYLSELYDIYQDWPLVIAAYNCGPGNVNKAIAKAGSSNFWDLQNYLPAESRNHVKKFIATQYIMEGQGGETTLTKSETEQLQAKTTGTVVLGQSTISISGKYVSEAIAQQLNMSISDFNRMNPKFDQGIAADGNYLLHLPSDKMNNFQQNKNAILEQSVRLMLGSARS